MALVVPVNIVVQMHMNVVVIGHNDISFCLQIFVGV